jgi:hypothetical protein
MGDLADPVILIFLVLAFYRFFKGVDQNLAVLVVIFGGVMPALIVFVNVVSDTGVLMVAVQDFALLPGKIQHAVKPISDLACRRTHSRGHALWHKSHRGIRDRFGSPRRVLLLVPLRAPG